MPMSVFLPVLTYPYPTDTANLRRAAHLAAHCKASIAAQLVVVDIPPVSEPPFSFGLDISAMAIELERASAAKADDLAATLATIGHTVGVSIATERTQCRMEFMGSSLAADARPHDLVAIGMAINGDVRSIVETVVFESGRPVVVIPTVGQDELRFETIAIAWDGSRAAARALHDALPLIHLAERVIVLTADRDKQIDPSTTNDVLSMLERHGADAMHLDVIVTSGKSTGEALQAAAATKGAGLLVMGAYGHSRVREFVLGGVTRSILTRLDMPVLLSH